LLLVSDSRTPAERITHAPRASTARRVVLFLRSLRAIAVAVREEVSMELGYRRQRVVLASAFVAALGISSAAFAQHFHGVITAHGDDGTMIVQSDDSSDVIVLLADGTKVRRLDGVRSTKVGAASLIPGLRVEVDGKYTDTTRFVAERVTFRKSDQKIARAIQGGLAPTDLRVAANQQRLELQAQILRQQGQQIAANDAKIVANDAKIVATTGMVEANSARISNLDDYNIIGSITVYFANGKSTIQSKYRHLIEDLVSQAKARDARGYVVQVQGYASAVGTEALNDRLSSERADAVARVLEQNGVPPTNLVPPAGMGISQQVASNKTEKGQAENRRAVITLLQNKGIAGQ
jgi:outer membrane protein OmpA-like peptidoglycan-associated protein